MQCGRTVGVGEQMGRLSVVHPSTQAKQAAPSPGPSPPHRCLVQRGQQAAERHVSRARPRVVPPMRRRQVSSQQVQVVHEQGVGRRRQAVHAGCIPQQLVACGRGCVIVMGFVRPGCWGGGLGRADARLSALGQRAATGPARQPFTRTRWTPPHTSHPPLAMYLMLTCCQAGSASGTPSGSSGGTCSSLSLRVGGWLGGQGVGFGATCGGCTSAPSPAYIAPTCGTAV